MKQVHSSQLKSSQVRSACGEEYLMKSEAPTFWPDEEGHQRSSGAIRGNQASQTPAYPKSMSLISLEPSLTYLMRAAIRQTIRGQSGRPQGL